ncbi:rRNA-processing protein efg1 [Erysiphe necator]|nr:rRNA-processing protein efg1 [Erysiphe necator]
MYSKGKHDFDANSQNVHESRHFQVYGKNLKLNKKRRSQEQNSHIIKSSSSINAIKKKLRDVNRRLGRPETISAEMQVEFERARDAYQLELNAAIAEKTRQRMIKKYHMVRFFERQKASRMIKRIRKHMLAANSIDEVHSLEKQLHGAEVDLNYTLYHPLSETYISLYPRNKSSAEECNSNQDIFKKKPPIWYEIEKAMVNGSLEEIRHRMSAKQVLFSKSNFESSSHTSKQGNTGNSAGLDHDKNKSKYRKVRIESALSTASKSHESFNIEHASDDKDNDSDGDFFE